MQGVTFSQVSEGLGDGTKIGGNKEGLVRPGHQVTPHTSCSLARLLLPSLTGSRCSTEPTQEPEIRTVLRKKVCRGSRSSGQGMATILQLRSGGLRVGGGSSGERRLGR